MPDDPDDEVDDAEATDEITRILAAQSGGGQIYMLVTTYDQADPLQATGQIHRLGFDREADPDMVLSAADTLTALWTSPDGHVWTASANGNVWTTAPVEFPPEDDEPAEVLTPLEDVKWQAGVLPELQQQGYRPNIACLYGFSDQDVFAGTFEGAIYHWDGTAWTEMPLANESGIAKMHARSRKHLYAVGENRTVLSYDGTRWNPVPMPEEVDEYTVLSGVRVVQAGQVYVCDVDGRIYCGDAGGMRVVAETKEKWYGLALRGKQILLAAPSGAWELVDDQPRVLRDTFAALDIYEAPPAIFFVEVEQPEPSMIEWNPNEQPPWVQRSF